MLEPLLEELLLAAAFPGRATLLRSGDVLSAVGVEPDGAASEHRFELGASYQLQVRVPAELDASAVRRRLEKILPLVQRALFRGGRVLAARTSPAGAPAAASVVQGRATGTSKQRPSGN